MQRIGTNATPDDMVNDGEDEVEQSSTGEQQNEPTREPENESCGDGEVLADRNVGSDDYPTLG